MFQAFKKKSPWPSLACGKLLAAVPLKKKNCKVFWPRKEPVLNCSKKKPGTTSVGTCWCLGAELAAFCEMAASCGAGDTLRVCCVHVSSGASSVGNRVSLAVELLSSCRASRKVTQPSDLPKELHLGVRGSAGWWDRGVSGIRVDSFFCCSLVLWLSFWFCYPFHRPPQQYKIVQDKQLWACSSEDAITTVFKDSASPHQCGVKWLTSCHIILSSWVQGKLWNDSLLLPSLKSQNVWQRLNSLSEQAFSLCNIQWVSLLGISSGFVFRWVVLMGGGQQACDSRKWSETGQVGVRWGLFFCLGFFLVLSGISSFLVFLWLHSS